MEQLIGVMIGFSIPFLFFKPLVRLGFWIGDKIESCRGEVGKWH